MSWIVFSVDGGMSFFNQSGQVMYADITVTTYTIRNTSGMYYMFHSDSAHYNNTGKYQCVLMTIDNVFTDSINVTVAGTS